MTSISVTSSSLLANLAASRMSTASRTTAVSSQSESMESRSSTLLTLNRAATNDVVYAKPLSTLSRAWASSQQDDVSALMARNNHSNGGLAGGLADQWRGLGGALLSRFATTGTNYRQAVVDYASLQRAAAAGRAEALDAQALNGVQGNAATVTLKIQTRSGQTVELNIAVNPGADGTDRGIQVEVSSSGPLSSSENKALAKLAKGLDQALSGLGQPDKLKLDMSQLMDYDSSALTSLDLSVKNPKADQALSSFALHLGDDRKTVAVKGAAGEIALNLDKTMPLGPASEQQRQSAINEHLRKFDAAAARGHADVALLEVFKDAFTQLHSSPTGQVKSPSSALSATLARQVQPLQSGLMDFQASFGGDFTKTNERGAVHELGHADYEFSQTTTVKQTGAAGASSIMQTQREKLDAQYIQSRSGGMLDTSTGNYDIYKIQDSNTSTTLIEAANDMLSRALKQTEQQQLKTYEKLVNHRTEVQNSTPLNKSMVEMLR